MGIEEFKKRNEPKGKRSKLAPYLESIVDLHESGYSQDQIRQFLFEEEGVDVSQAGLSKFIAIHVKDSESHSSKLPPPRVVPQKSAPTSTFLEKKKRPEVDIDDLT